MCSSVSMFDSDIFNLVTFKLIGLPCFIHLVYSTIVQVIQQAVFDKQNNMYDLLNLIIIQYFESINQSHLAHNLNLKVCQLSSVYAI